jgi:hypothetical protein
MYRSQIEKFTRDQAKGVVGEKRKLTVAKEFEFHTNKRLRVSEEER